MIHALTFFPLLTFGDWITFWLEQNTGDVAGIYDLIIIPILVTHDFSYEKEGCKHAHVLQWTKISALTLSSSSLFLFAWFWLLKDELTIFLPPCFNEDARVVEHRIVDRSAHGITHFRSWFGNLFVADNWISFSWVHIICKLRWHCYSCSHLLPAFNIELLFG